VNQGVVVRWAVRIVALAAFGGLVACDASSRAEPTGTGVQDAVPSESYGLVTKIQRAKLTVPLLGTRVYRLFDGTPGGNVVAAYREQVASDGNGQFAVDILDWLEPPLSPSEEALQLQVFSSRAGLLYRHRGFAIRDLPLFLDNFTLTALGTTTTVAGIQADEYSVELSDASSTRWVLAVDPTTGVVLRAIEEQTNGILLSTVEFESIDYTPDLSGVAWFQASIGETVVGPSDPLPFAFDVLDPVLIPEGYDEIELSEVVEPVTGSSWAKRTFSNGVDVLFFLQTNETPDLDLAKPYQAPEVASYSAGSWQVLDGTVSGQRVVLLGKVGESELAQMLQSSL